MPPIPISFSLHAPTSGKLASTAQGHYITIAAPVASSPTPRAPPPTANQRRKAAPLMPGATPKAALVPMNVTIVTRCLIRPAAASPPANGKKRSNNHTPAASPTPSQPPAGVQPYNRASDLANTRSTRPSPQELLRAERAEEEKARQKKENAAAARAAAALARRRKALRSGRGASRMPSASVQPATMIPPIQRAVAAQRARSAEAAAAEAHAAETTNGNGLLTAEPEDGVTRMKRTRSSGLANSSTATGAVATASPLRTVTAASDDDATQQHAPKRSRLSESAGPTPPTRTNPRRATTSPPGANGVLPATDPASPRKPGRESLSPAEPMRRVVSAVDTGAHRRTTSPRTSSVGPDAAAIQRARRDVQPPARMRDYDR